MNFINRREKSNNILQKIFFLILCLLIIVNPFPLGSNRTWAWSFEAMVAVSSLMLMVTCSLFSNNFISWSRLKKMKVELILIGAWLFINLFYLIPLPLGLISLISPNVANAYADINLSYGFLTLDVYASFQTFMLSFYYFTVFILGVILINSRKRIKFILVIFLILGVVQSVYAMYLVSIGQTGTIVQIVLVTPNNASGTFINKNHFVAFLSLCFLFGMALRMTLKSHQTDTSHLDVKIRFIRFVSHPMRLLDFCLFLIIAGIWNTHSRAGMASFLLALCFLGLFIFLNKKNKSINYKKLFSIFIIGVFLLILFADDVNYLMKVLGQDTEDSLGFVMNTAEGRLLAFNQVMENFSSYWFSGVGPGAYQVFFVNHRVLEQTAYFDHAHNDYIEFLIEYGLFSVLILILLIVFMYKIFVFIFNTRSSFYKNISICVISSIIYMLLHGIMDFNARIPANVFTIILAISVIYGRIMMSDVNKSKK